MRPALKVFEMGKLIRQIRSFGSLRKGCSVHAGHRLLVIFKAVIELSLMPGVGVRKPKHSSGHPPDFRGSNFLSSPQGGFLYPTQPLMMDTSGGKKDRYRGFSVKYHSETGGKRLTGIKSCFMAQFMPAANLIL